MPLAILLACAPAVRLVAHAALLVPDAALDRQGLVLVVEAAETFGWHKYIGLDGDSVTMSSFGASAPGGICMEKFGFTVENVLEKSRSLLNK